MKRTYVFLCLVLLAASAAQAAFVKQPYLQNLAGSTIVVRWETQAAQTGKVEYGLSTGYGAEVSHSNSAVDHELTLTGLQQDTLYHYRAISGADTSPDAVFHANVTGNRPFRFFVYGDDRSDSAGHQSVVNRMLQQSPVPRLALNVGDMTYDGSTPVYQTFFNISRGLLRSLPLYPVIGNHDKTNMTDWFRFLALPNNERWYSLRYDNSAFICLDNYSTYTPGSTEYNWLVAELSADSADAAVRHIFVLCHEPPYTTNTGHSSNLTIRQYLCPLFERFHVAMVFTGHVHCYEHSLVNGVHYITSGGGGAPLYTTWNAPQSWTVYREATFEFVLVDVAGDTVRTVGIRPNGGQFDPLTIVTPPAGVEGPRSPVISFLRAAPNPFSDRVWFTLEAFAGPARVEVRDIFGRTIAVLHDRDLRSGRISLAWDASGVPAGLYFGVVTTSQGTSTVPLVRTPSSGGRNR